MADATGLQLSQYAIQIAEQTLARAQAFKPERLQIETRLKQIEAITHAADMSRKRLRDYVVKIGPHYQCPRCWVNHENRTDLSPVSSDTKDDLFACDRCGLDILIEMD